MRLSHVAFVVAFSATLPVSAQEAFNDGLPPPENSLAAPIIKTPPDHAWVDLRQSAAAHSTSQNAPNWVEAVSMSSTSTTDGAQKTIFRIRVRKPPGDYRVLFSRLFFDDSASARPQIVAWDESGSQVLRSGPLGTGVELPTSDSVMIPMNGISTIDVEVPGDGKSIRGIYLDWMTSSEVVHPVNTEHRDVIPEPFSSLPALHSPSQDLEQFGTVTASLAAETVAIGSTVDQGGIFEFGIESQPLLALLTFEVASPRVDAPPEIYLNGEDIGPATLTLPELADPGYRGQTQPLVNQMRFQYTGWLRAQKIVPAANLKTGTNNFVIVAGANRNSAIRATQLQLKYLWDKSDYVLEPGH